MSDLEKTTTIVMLKDGQTTYTVPKPGWYAFVLPGGQVIKPAYYPARRFILRLAVT